MSSKGTLPKNVGSARRGQMTPHDAGHTPERTKMSLVAKIAGGTPPGGNGNVPSMPHGQVNKHNK